MTMVGSTECSDARPGGEALSARWRSLQVISVRCPCAALSFASLAFSKFHPGEKVLERAFRHRCAGMFSRALPLRLVEDDVRSAHGTVLKG